MRRQQLVTTALVFLAVVCTAGAVWTVYWSVRFGLTPRSPLSPLQTALRFAIVTLAVILLPFRRDWIERTALLCAVVAAGSSALFGLGFRSTTLDFVRLLFHFLAYALVGFVSVRLLARLWRGNAERATEATHPNIARRAWRSWLLGVKLPMDQPTCCKKPSWISELDLGHAGGFDFVLGKCDGCGEYAMNVFCVASGITGFETITSSDLEKMKSTPPGPELKALMRKWGEQNI